jgi:hypothetical protein
MKDVLLEAKAMLGLVCVEAWAGFVRVQGGVAVWPPPPELAGPPGAGRPRMAG